MADFLPIDASPFYSRRGPAVRARLERLNPHGLKVFHIPRGWHPHQRINHFEWHTMPVREFISRFGRAAYDSLPPRDVLRQGHRKAVAYRALHEVGAA